MQDDSHRATGDDARRWLLAGAPVKERRLDLAGVSTAVLEAGDGRRWCCCTARAAGRGCGCRWSRSWPTANRWSHPTCRAWAHRRCRTPAGRGAGAGRWLGADRAHLPGAAGAVGASLGGSIAARFAITHPDRLSRLVLVDSGSLARFRPAPGLALAMIRFIARRALPRRVLRQVLVDPTRLRGGQQRGRLSRRTTSTLPARRACGPPTAGCFGSSERGRSRPSSSARTVPTALIWATTG